MNNTEFINWLEHKMDINGLNKRALSIGAKLDATHLGRVLKGKHAGNDFLRALADFFSMPDEEIFWIAGELRSRMGSKRTRETVEFENLIRDLPESERAVLMTIVRAFHKNFVQ
jgi:hypothetical protein